MSAYKQFTSKDIIVSPLTVHVSSSQVTHNAVSSFTGSSDNTIFLSGSGILTGSYPLNDSTGINNTSLVLILTGLFRVQFTLPLILTTPKIKMKEEPFPQEVVKKLQFQLLIKKDLGIILNRGVLK